MHVCTNRRSRTSVCTQYDCAQKPKVLLSLRVSKTKSFYFQTGGTVANQCLTLSGPTNLERTLPRFNNMCKT